MTQTSRPVGPGDHVFLVDGSSFVFRAYFQSIRQDQKYNYRSDRLPIGAVRLFATKILQFVREGAAGIKPTHLAIIFDKSENSFRREIYPPYKAHRPDPPPDLVPAISADARDGARLRHDPGRTGSLRGRRPYRHLRDAGAREGRGRPHRVGRQGPHAARRAGDRDVRSRLGRRRSHGGAADRAGRSRRLFRRRRGQGHRHPGARRRFHRQRARRAGHRRQDRRAVDRRIWRSRHVAGARRRDQTGQAPGDADQPGDGRTRAPVEDARHAGARRRRPTCRSSRSAFPVSTASR